MLIETGQPLAGLVANPTSSGTPAAAQRPRSLVHDFGRCTPRRGTYARARRHTPCRPRPGHSRSALRGRCTGVAPRRCRWHGREQDRHLTATLAGLGNEDVRVIQTVSGSAVYQCQNKGGNTAPGQNKVLVGPVTTPVIFPASAIKNGNLTNTVSSTHDCTGNGHGGGRWLSEPELDRRQPPRQGLVTAHQDGSAHVRTSW